MPLGMFAVHMTIIRFILRFRKSFAPTRWKNHHPIVIAIVIAIAIAIAIAQNLSRRRVTTIE